MHRVQQFSGFRKSPSSGAREVAVVFETSVKALSTSCVDSIASQRENKPDTANEYILKEVK